MLIRMTGVALTALSGAAVLAVPCVDACAAARAAQPADDGAADPALRAYLSGNGFLNRGMYELAVTEYRKFLEAHAGHAKANTARYALGVSLSRMKQHAEAAKELDGLATVKGFEFAAEVRLLLGQCAIAEGKFADAAGWFERLRSEFPEHARAEDASALLVECRYRAGELEASAKACADFAARWPDSKLRARVELFGALAEMGTEKFHRAGERLDALLAKDSESVLAPQAMLLAAQCRHRTGELPRALELYRAAVKAQERAGNKTDAAQACLGMATLLYQQGKGPEAAKLLDEIIAKGAETPSAPAARLARGRVHFDAGEYEKATRLFGAAAEDVALADQAEYWLAKCELRSGDGAACAKRLKKAIGAHPKSTLLAEMTYDRGVALLRAGDEAGAGEALGAFRQRFPKHALDADALETLADLAHTKGDHDGSARLCAEFASKYPDHARAGTVALLAAENEQAAGRLESAAEKFRAFLSSHAEDTDAPRARLCLGTVHLRLEKPDEAVPFFESVVKGKNTEPAFRAALLYLGDIHLRAGRFKQAERALADYVALGLDQPSADSALLSLGLALSRQEKHGPAVAEFDRLLGRFPESAVAGQARFERAQALLAMGRGADAKAGFESVVADSGGKQLNAYALSHLGALAMEAKDYAGAAGYFEKAAGTAGDDKARAEALFNRAQAMLAGGQSEEASKVLAELSKKYPTHPRAQQGRAQRALTLARANPDQAALTEIEAVLSGGKPEASLSDALNYERARCLRELSRADEAKSVLRDLIDSPGDGSIRAYARLELAAIEEDGGRPAEAAAALAPLFSQNATGLPKDLVEQAAYRMGAGLFKAGKYAESAPILAKFLTAFPESTLNASVCLMLGESYFKQDKHRQAAPLFKRVTEEFSDDTGAATALLRLGECLANLQDWDGSRAAFGSYLQGHGGDEMAYQARFGVAWADENQGKHEEAMAGYRAVTEKQRGPTGARAQFQIGECLFAQKKYDEAVAELLKVDILYAYPEWSAAALYEAGRCFDAAGKPDQAREQYELVKAKYPESKWAVQAGKRLKPAGRAGDGSRAGK